MLAELVNADGESRFVQLHYTPPLAEITVLERPVARTPQGTGLVVGFPTRTYRLRPWSVGHPAVYDEVQIESPASTSA